MTNDVLTRAQIIELAEAADAAWLWCTDDSLSDVIREYAVEAGWPLPTDDDLVAVYERCLEMREGK